MIRKIRKQIRKNRGFTLVELMIVVAIVGILAALAIYGVRKYMANAKTAEARNGIGQMAKDAITAYFKEGMAPSLMALKGSTTVNNKLCDGATVVAVPTAADIKGAKYQSEPTDWESWDCLHWSMNDPQYYIYDYKTPGRTGDALGTDGAVFNCTAQGDLDGDGTLSTFTMTGGVQTDSKGVLTASAAPNLKEDAADE